MRANRESLESWANMVDIGTQWNHQSLPATCVPHPDHFENVTRVQLKISLSLFVVGICGLIALMLLHSQEPYYRGLPISFWINHLGDGIPDSLTNQVWNSLEPTDPRTVPFLMKALKKRDGRLQVAYQDTWRRLPWLRLPTWVKRRLPTPLFAATARANAAFILGKIGVESRPAIPILLQLLKGDDDYQVRWMAADCLGKIAPNDKIIKSALTEALLDNDRHPVVRNAARDALKQIDRNALREGAQ